MSFLPRISRRQFLATLAATTLAPRPPTLPASGRPESPTSRRDSPLAPFDREVEEFMKARQVPGGALAVVKDRRLVHARGFGWADRDRQTPARADSLFRIASVSKPFTAVAVLRLVEEGRLSLSDRPFELLRLPALETPGKRPDPRLKRITVRQLLHHTGGWDRDKSFDPMFRSREIAEACGVPSPAGPREILRYMQRQPLDFDPGARYAYSNFGYCVLGRVIEHVVGGPYGSYLRGRLLQPLGIRRMRLGASLESGRAPGEVRYYTARDSTTQCVFGKAPQSVPWPYGGFCLEAMDAHGGWLASAVDLARFTAALDEPRRSRLLKPESFEQLLAPPDAPVARNPDGSSRNSYYGCGWSVRRVDSPGQVTYWHNGSLPGTFSLLVRRWDGLSWAVLFNQRSEDSHLPDLALDRALHRAADAVARWPSEDLFSRYST